jgi:hypothetical protein
MPLRTIPSRRAAESASGTDVAVAVMAGVEVNSPYNFATIVVPNVDRVRRQLFFPPAAIVSPADRGQLIVAVAPPYCARQDLMPCCKRESRIRCALPGTSFPMLDYPDGGSSASANSASISWLLHEIQDPDARAPGQFCSSLLQN